MLFTSTFKDMFRITAYSIVSLAVWMTGCGNVDLGDGFLAETPHISEEVATSEAGGLDSVHGSRRAAPPRTEFWMHPNKSFDERIQSMDSFLFGPRNLNSWQDSFELMDAYQVHVQALDQYQEPRFMETLVETLVAGQKKIVLTAGGLDASVCNAAKEQCIASGGSGRSSDPACARHFSTVGTDSAHKLIEAVEANFYYDGRMVLHTLSLDGAMKRAMGCSPNQGGHHCNNACQFPVDQAIEQVTEYFWTLNNRYPSLKFDYVFNFLNWNMSLDARGERLVQSLRGPGRSLGMDADLRFVIRDLVDSLRARGLHLDSIANEGGAFFYANQSWDPNYPEGQHTDWFSRLVALRQLTDELGIKSHQAINVTTGMNDCAPYTPQSDPYNRCVRLRDQNAQRASLGFVRRYQREMEAAGFPPNAEIMDTMQWKNIPEQTLSETDDSTFMNMFLTQMNIVGNP